MVSASEILLRIRGRDETGSAFSSVESKAKGMGSAVSGAVGMAVGMIGYDLFNSLVEAGRGAVNASGQLDYFAGRLGMSEQQSANFRSELDSMQQEFKKVNMTAVGATAEDLASRYQLPIDKLGDLTNMTAVMSSEFIRNGRSQEDAVLAVADAMDGQFKRLQEIGITQDTLKKNGWNGNLEDQASLIDALNKSMEGLGYDKIAKDITNLDDAYAALTVTGGNLIASVLVPLTPIIIQITEGISNLINFVMHNGWAQGAILIAALAVGFVLLAGSLVTAEGAFIGFEALMPAFITSLYGVASGFMAITIAGAPLWAIVAVIAAIALAVYELGIYFGWWSDVGSMLAAISDGVRRLWEAFINNPHVQAAIAAVQNALQQLWTFVQPVFAAIGQAWTNLFGEAGSKPDVVRGIIDAFGRLGDIAAQAFGTISSVASQAYSALAPIGATISRIVTVISRLFSGEISFEGAIFGLINNLGILSSQMGQLSLRVGRMLFNGIINAIRPLPARIWQFLMQAANRILSFGLVAANLARMAGLRILQGMVNNIRQIPARVGAFMRQIPSRISSAAGAAVSAAMNLANSAKDAVVQGFQGMADTVYQEFMNIGSKINDAVSGAVSAAANFGSQIKDAVLNALHIASPGIIQRKIAIEFQDIPGRIGESNDAVYSAARDYGGNILRGFNAPQMNLGALRDQTTYTPTSNHSNVTIVHVHENAVPVDARNMTQREAQGVVTLALESLGNIPTTGGK